LAFSRQTYTLRDAFTATLQRRGKKAMYQLTRSLKDMRCSNTSCSHKHPPGCADDTSDVGLALVEPRWPPLRSASGACESRRKRKRNERVQNTALHLSPEVKITH
ncbi:unnamed protein product, partial [Rangifer tarandus platyrhynchus]